MYNLIGGESVIREKNLIFLSSEMREELRDKILTMRGSCLDRIKQILAMPGVYKDSNRPIDVRGVLSELDTKNNSEFLEVNEIKKMMEDIFIAIHFTKDLRKLDGREALDAYARYIHLGIYINRDVTITTLLTRITKTHDSVFNNIRPIEFQEYKKLLQGAISDFLAMQSKSTEKTIGVFYDKAQRVKEIFNINI